MNNEQKTIVGIVIANNLASATPIQIANYHLLTKAQQNAMIAGWVQDRKNLAQLKHDGADAVAAADKAAALAEISLYDSILALV